MKLHYGKLAAALITATTAQQGFGAANLGSAALDMPWRAAATGAEDVVFTLPAAGNVETFEVHDVNFAAATVYKSSDGVVFTLVGVLTTYCGKEGRRRGKITIHDPNVVAIKLSVAAGATTDGLTFWRAGAGYLFSSMLVVPSPLQWGYGTHFVYPQTSTQLANKQRAIAAVGTRFHEITVVFRPQPDLVENLEPFVTQSRGPNVVLLDLDLVSRPSQFWPARLIEDDMTEAFNEPAVSDISLKFTEAVS